MLRGELTLQSSFLELVFFAFHAIMMYVFIPVTWLKLPPLSNHPVWHIVSLISILLGLIILGASMVPLGFKRTMGLKSSNLKTNGLYKISRNPQVIGYSFVLTGFIISYFSVYAIGWFVLFGINIHWMVLSEEEYLKKKYGEIFEAYLREVPRYLDARSFRNIFR